MDRRGRDRLPRGDDRPLRAQLRGRVGLVARIKDESVERVKATMEILPARRGRRPPPQVGQHVQGAVPVPLGEDAELHRLARARHLQVLRLRRGRRRDHVRREEREPRLRRRDRAARAPLRRRARVRGGVARAGAEAAARRTAARAARAGGRVLRPRALGVGSGRRRAGLPRLPRPRRGGLPRVPARVRTGRGAARRRARCRRATRRTSCSRSGSRTGRGNDYFQRRIVFPLADARGSVRGFQARKLHDDDPLQAKYVNSPEGELFRKGDLLYGLDTARQAIAREDRAVVVEGNTDVLALRQAGFAPVVASMGTALTEAQLRELTRLTKRLFLCFDADAAGQDATLRGMELAVRDGFTVRVVPLSAGHRSRGRSRRLRGAAGEARQLPGAPRAARCTRGRPTASAAFTAIEAFLRVATRLARAPRRAAPRGRSARPAAGDAGGARAAHADRALPASSPRASSMPDRDSSAAPSPASPRHESLLPGARARSARSTSTTSCTVARERICSGRSQRTAS